MPGVPKDMAPEPGANHDARSGPGTGAGSTQGSLWMLAVILCGQALAAMDTAIVNVAAPTLQAELGLSGASLQLTVAGYGLAYASFLITAARLGDLYGYRRLFMLGVAVFTISSLVCGTAQTAGILIVGRILQGLGAALLVPQVLSLIQLSYSGAAKARAVGLYSMILGLGAAAGQLLGGVIVDVDLWSLSWRPAFLINIPVGVALIGLALFFLPRIVERRRVRLDLVGVLAVTGVALCVLIPLTFGREFGWPVWSLVMIGAGLLALVAFWRYEQALSGRGGAPLVDPALLTIRGVPQGLGIVAVGFIGYGGWLLTVALYLQVGLGFSPLVSGVTFGAYAAGFGVWNLFWSRLPDRIVTHAPSVALATLLCASLAFGSLVSDGWWHPVLGPLLLFGAGSGHGLSFGTSVNRMTAVIPSSFAASLSGLVTSCSQFSIVTGTALLGSVYFAVAASVPDGENGSGAGMSAVAFAVAIGAGLGLILSARLPSTSLVSQVKSARPSDG